jgi:uncharacterized protein
VRLSEQMQRVVSKQRLGFVATVTPDGSLSVSPKGTTRIWDDEQLFFADIASPGTVANLRANPHVEVNVVDPIRRKGSRFKGTATVHTSGATYERGLQILRDQASTANRERVRSIVVIGVVEVAELISPPTTTAPPSKRSPRAGSTTTGRCTAPRLAVPMSALNDPCPWTQPMPTHSPTSTPSPRRGWSRRVRCRRPNCWSVSKEPAG